MEQTIGLTMQISYSCGCGFYSHLTKLAMEHAAAQSHAITIHGMIRPPQQKPQVKLVSKKERD